LNQKPIFLLGLHKSGTSLLRSLFDGHPDLYTIPIETHYFQNMHYWVDNEYRHTSPKIVSRDEIISSFTNWIDHSNTAEDKFADSMTKNLFSLSDFKNEFSKIQENVSDKIRIEKYFESIYFSIEKMALNDNLRVVEKSVENAEFASELARHFPGAQFVHIIRNPYSNLVALRKYKSFRYGFPIISRVLKTFYNSYYYLYKNMRTIDNYYLLKYEDLVTSPQIHINKLCEFLNLKWQDSLLKPTFRGKHWGGNSTTGESFKQISSINLYSWQQEIHPMEVYYLNTLFPFVFKDFRYNPYQKKGNFWKYAKGENFKRYITNRLYKFYVS
jgi:protein-tyrosine sulfotransferase